MENILNEVITLFAEKYTPAQSLDDATTFLDTEEIYDAITRIAPNMKIEKEGLFEALRNNGYVFNIEPNKLNFNLKWMLIRKN